MNNTKINNLHERLLRLIYSEKKSSYEKLLGKNGSVSFHHRNIQLTHLLKNGHYSQFVFFVLMYIIDIIRVIS